MDDLGDHRIFISYSRKDGADFAAKLRERLEEAGFSIWQDLVALQGGSDWWSQIEDVLRSKHLRHLILVVTPGALQNAVVRREIRLARQEGKTVLPVKGPGVTDLYALPRWIGVVDDLDWPERLAAFLRVLEGPSTQKRVAMMVPELPEDFVERPAEFGALKSKLLDAKGDAVAISAALKGAGGYGKTTLAKALAHDQDIQDAYFDGILYIELGQKPENLLSGIADLIEILSGERPGVETINAAAAKFAETLGERRILLVIDDVWREQDLRPLLQGGKNTTRLITTRLANVLPQSAVRHPVDAMTTYEAHKLLASGLPPDQVELSGADLTNLARRLGHWAQFLKLVNGFLRDRVNDFGESLKVSIADANFRLDEEGLPTFDADDEADRSKAIARTINLTLRLLTETERERFSELAVFPEDTDIPIYVVGQLWRQRSDLKPSFAKDLIGKLYKLSLLLSLDPETKTIRLHDTTRHFLRHEAGPSALQSLNQSLIVSLNPATSSQPDAQSRLYYFNHLPQHLSDAGARRRLDELLLDPRWLRDKLAATGSPQALVRDYERFGEGEAQILIGRTLKLSAGICARDHRQLMPQIFGRLMACPIPAVSGFNRAVRQLVNRPAILSRFPSLTPPGGTEITRLEVKAGGVEALAVLPDGKLAAAGGNGTIWLWDLATGVEVARLEGHASKVSALAVLPDGRLASGSWDKTVRLWDVVSGTETARLEGHTDGVNALAVLPDGRLASGSSSPSGKGDNTIRLWDVDSGTETARFEGKGREVRALAVLPDGRLASGGLDRGITLWNPDSGAATGWLSSENVVSALAVLPDNRVAFGPNDATIRLWDVARGVEIARSRRLDGFAKALAVLPDGRLASGNSFSSFGASDYSVRLWDPGTCAEDGRLTGHTGSVHALVVLPDGRLASGSWDNTIRLWDLAGENEIPRAGAHDGGVNALTMLPGDLVASASEDDTIRLWDPSSGAETARLSGHYRPVNALAVMPDGRLASASDDTTIRLWDSRTNGDDDAAPPRGQVVDTSGIMEIQLPGSGSEAEPLRMFNDGGTINALTVLADGRLASGCKNSAIRLWDAVQRAETARLLGHAEPITALVVLPDGRLASGSEDKTIRLWDLVRGTETARLCGHAGAVTSLAMLPDGRLASGSWDGTIRLWDLRSGVEIAQFKGHAHWVMALAVMSDGRLVSGSRDKTIRLWDPAITQEVTRLEVDAPTLSICILSENYLVAGDDLGRLHWLEIVDKGTTSVTE